MIVTSTSCSASCGSRTNVRTGLFSRMILGTSITCSATGTKHRQTGAHPPAVPTSAAQENRESRATVRRQSAPQCAADCGMTTARRSGRDPAAGTSSTSREKYSVPAAWGSGMLLNVTVYCHRLSVELSGARQGPCGRSAVRVCTTNAAAALCVAEKHHPQVVAS